MSEPTYTISADGSAILCRVCRTTSYNPSDVRERYCGKCKMFHTAAQPAPMQFRHMITGQPITPSDWQRALTIGDYYQIDNSVAAVGDEDTFTTYDIPTIYGQIESDEACPPGFFWVKAYSTDCPRGETGSFNICEATRQITKEEFEQARQRKWARP